MKFIKEKKSPTPQLPKEENGMSIKTARLLFPLLITFLVISGPLAFFKTNQMADDIHKQQKLLTQAIQKELKQNVASPVSSELYKQFLGPFIETYINVPTKQQDFEKRLESLQNNYFGIELEEEKNTGTERKLLSSEFYDLSINKNQTIAQYRIAYEIISPVTKEREIKKKEDNKEITVKETYIDYEKNHTQILLNIPFTQLDNQSFKVTNYPFFTIEPSLISGKHTLPTLDVSRYEPVEAKEEKAITAFIKSFLNKYVSASLEDMAFIMKEPEVLTSAYEIKNPQIEVVKKEKQFVAFVTIDVFDQKTTMSHKEHLTLILKKRDTTYFIDKLHHYLGGI
ncbi:conjugal transfer protein [Vagococcus fluvialis]|uniref:conjugal transfer protein n=1 Tax=Vagococcus fluvialis TaxID=2738 RepID=UPI0037BA704A